MKPIGSDTILQDAVMKELEDDPAVALRRGVSSIRPDAPMMVTRARRPDPSGRRQTRPIRRAGAAHRLINSR